MASGGCASYADKVARDIPPPPAYAQSVIVPDPKAVEDARVVAARERAGRLRANRIIRALKGDWNKMRTDLRG